MSAKSKPRGPPLHPPYSEMIKAAIVSLKERGGSSRQGITKYMTATYNLDSHDNNVKTHVRKALKKSVASGDIILTKGTGAAGSYKIGKPIKPVEKPKKKTVKKPAAKKPAAKKPAAKKPAAKKPAAKKPSAQKPKSPKAKPGAKTTKKSGTPKKAAKKTPKKTPKSPAKKKVAKKPAAKKTPTKKVTKAKPKK